MKQKSKIRGLDLLKQRRVALSQDDLQFGDSIPIFLLFYKYFNHGDFGSSMTFLDDFLVEFDNLKHPIMSTLWFDNLNINGRPYNDSFVDLLSPSMLKIEYNNYKSKFEFWNDEGFMIIGYMDSSDAVLLGMEQNKEDEIWIQSNYLDGIFHKLADNIFHFFTKCEVFWTNEKTYPKNAFDLNNLFYSWREKKWFLKE